MEIHDTLAQGLSSQQMLLQAADRTWTADPDAARRHVRTATGIAERNLAEARRFVHDLAPADLAEGGGLRGGPVAWRPARAPRRRGRSPSAAMWRAPRTPRCRTGSQSALLRIAQGALANVRGARRRHRRRADPDHLDDQVVLDIADNGRGFTPEPGAPRGYGRRYAATGCPRCGPACRQLGGTLTVESAPGEGTVLSAAIPPRAHRPRPPRRPPHDRRGIPAAPSPRPPPYASCSATTTSWSAPACWPCLGSEPDIEVVGEAGSGEEAVALAARLTPDVVLMDLQLGEGIDGVEATRRIAGGGTVHVLVLTTYDTDADITRAIEAGATGYLLKAERPEELFAAIRSAAQGRTALSAPVANRVMARMRSPAPPSPTGSATSSAQLSQGLGNRDIARALFISEATVKTHLGRIYDKLGVDTRAGAVSVAKEQRLLP